MDSDFVSEPMPDVIYRKAPIIEAVIELRFPARLNDGQFKKLCDHLRRKYDSALDQQRVEIQVNAATADFEKKNALPSFRMASADQTQISIVEWNRIVWSRLAPYGGWADFMLRVEPEMRQMAKLVGDRRPERIGMRFINRIDVPMSGDGTFRYEDYISINLNLPTELDPVMAYQWRIDRQFPDRKAAIMIQSATALPEIPGTVAFLLDIDAYSTVDLPLKVDEILSRLSDLRSLKNEIFELSITSLARETFE